MKYVVCAGRGIESNGERNRGVYIMKSRGMKHSKQVREFIITDKGLQLVDVFLSPEGILIGSAREAQQLNEATGIELRSHAANRKDREVERRRLVLEAKIASLKQEFESVEDELNKTFIEEDLKQEIMERNRQKLTKTRSSRNTENGKTK